MDESIRLGHLGLSDNEVSVLKSFFTLSDELNESFHLIGSDNFDTADLLLLNVDNSAAIRKWKQIKRVNRLVTPIVLSAKGKPDKDVISLTLPLRLPKLIAVLQDVVNEKTRVNALDGVSNSREYLQILVVGDSFAGRKQMVKILTDFSQVSTRISFADSGENAMLKYKNRAHDLVFLDIGMKGLDGYKICKAIKLKNINTYVALLSTNLSALDKVRCAMSGCDATILKPVEPVRINEVLENCLMKLREKGEKFQLLNSNRVSKVQKTSTTT